MNQKSKKTHSNKSVLFYFASILALLILLLVGFNLLKIISVATVGVPPQKDYRDIKQIDNLVVREWFSGDDFYYLYDLKNNLTLVKDIKHVIVSTGTAYSAGIMNFSIRQDDLDEEKYYLHESQVNGELEQWIFDDPYKMPEYLKFNTTTADAEWFYSLDDMSVEDREIFTKLEEGENAYLLDRIITYLD